MKRQKFLEAMKEVTKIEVQGCNLILDLPTLKFIDAFPLYHITCKDVFK